MELLAPLDPTKHVTYIEGVLAALGRYTDAQVTHAVTRVAATPAANPIGLLVDRAKKSDPIYFPTTVPALRIDQHRVDRLGIDLPFPPVAGVFRATDAVA